MESFFTRYRNAAILALALLAQLVGLATQVKRPEAGGTRLLRVWVVSAITPLERGLVDSSQAVRHVWSNYFYLRGVRRENRELREQVEQLRIERVRLAEDAAQARRLQALFGFKEQFISQTLPAQVIGTSGSELSRIIYVDKGSNHGVKVDMAVITPDGIVGKILRVFKSSSQVLLINDASSGVGAILEKSRLQGIIQGTAAGEVVLRYVMSDEKVEPGERILTSGGDGIFPKGLPLGAVTQSNPGSDLFLNIRVKPSADLSRLEEVLIVTRVLDKEAQTQQASEPVRAADILAQRLPSVPPKSPVPAKAAVTPAPDNANATNASSTTGAGLGSRTGASAATSTATTNVKPATGQPSSPTGAKPATSASKPANGRAGNAVPAGPAVIKAVQANPSTTEPPKPPQQSAPQPTQSESPKPQPDEGVAR